MWNWPSSCSRRHLRLISWWFRLSIRCCHHPKKWRPWWVLGAKKNQKLSSSEEVCRPWWVLGATAGNLKWKSDPHCHQAFTLLPLVHLKNKHISTSLPHVHLIFVAVVVVVVSIGFMLEQEKFCQSTIKKHRWNGNQILIVTKLSHCCLWYILSL